MKKIDDNQALDKTKKNFLWVQEFSKKVIVVLLLIYIIYFFGSMVALFKMILEGNVIGFETITTEINETFRFIVGGYLIKAGLENITKIGGDYYGSVAKIKIIKEKQANGLDITDQDIENIDTSDSDSNDQY